MLLSMRFVEIGADLWVFEPRVLLVTMRNRQWKFYRGSSSKETLTDAVIEVIESGDSLRRPVKNHDVHYSTYVATFRKLIKSALETNVAVPNPGYKPNAFFR